MRILIVHIKDGPWRLPGPFFDKGGKVLPRGRPSKNRRYRAKSTALALVLVLLTAGLISVSAEPAFAGDEPTFGTLEVGASNWMTANGGGVDVYSNGDSGYTSNDYSSPAVGMKWQCVELTQRLYQAKGWHSGYWSGVTYAYQIYDNASTNGLVAHPNDGNYTPVPGDMIIHSPSTGDVAGHVAVVDYVSNGKVYVVEQNVGTSGESSAGHASYTIGTNGVLTRDQSVGLSIRGIVHSPNDPYTNTSDYRAVFQANTGYMFTQDWPGSPANTNQGMKSGTNPAIGRLSTGVYEEVFQANTGNLYVYNSNGSGGTTSQPMMAGTSPAIAPWTINGDYRVAFQGSDGHLHTYDSYSGPLDTTKAMASGTSPAIAVISTGSYQMAYQGTNGDLWVYNSGGSGSDTNQPMASGTSPSIAPWVNGGSYRVAFQGSDGYLHYYDSYSGPGSTGKAMASGTSPVITRISTNSYQMAYQGTNGDLWVLNSGGSGADTYQGMASGTSPSIAPWINGGSYRVAFQANNGYLYYYDSYSGPGSTSQGMASGTSPSIAAHS